MTNEERIKSVKEAVQQGRAYSFLEQLENYGDFPDFSAFKNFLLLILVLIEEESVFESSATLMLKKIYQEHTAIGKFEEDEYGKNVLSAISELAISPYVNVTTAFRRIIGTIIYDFTGNETAHIVRVTPRTELLRLNETFLLRYVTDNKLDDSTMSLFYNCVADIDLSTYQISLSNRACETIREKILKDGFDEYLYRFIRPYYSAMSSYWLPDANFHVPEPFCPQIFGSYDNFMALLQKRVSLNKNDTAKQVYDFMIFYSQSGDRKIVDVSRLNLTKGFHQNVRFLDRNNPANLL